MVQLLYLILAFICPLTMGQMFNSIAEMLNPQILNAVFGNPRPIAGQSVNVGTGGNLGPTAGTQTVNTGGDGNINLSQDDGTLNFGLPPTMGEGGFPQPGRGFPPFGGSSPTFDSGTNQNLGQISQSGIGNTINVASPSLSGQSNNLLVGQITQQGVGNVINVGQNQTQLTLLPPSSRNLNVGQLQQQGIGNTANFGRSQQALTTRLLPTQTPPTVSQPFRTPPTQNPLLGPQRVFEQVPPSPFQRQANQFPLIRQPSPFQRPVNGFPLRHQPPILQRPSNPFPPRHQPSPFQRPVNRFPLRHQPTFLQRPSNRFPPRHQPPPLQRPPDRFRPRPIAFGSFRPNLNPFLGAFSRDGMGFM